MTPTIPPPIHTARHTPDGREKRVASGALTTAPRLLSARAAAPRGRTHARDLVHGGAPARSFAAAPYRVVGAGGGGRVELVLLTVEKANAGVQASALAGAVAALEHRLGPYPTGCYAIAEVPKWAAGCLASSEQGFMMAKPENFDVRGFKILRWDESYKVKGR